MPRDLFGDVVHPGPGLGAHTRSAVPLSLVVHAALAAIVIIVPLMATGELPRPHEGEVVSMPLDRRVPELPPATATKATVATRSSSVPSLRPTAAPIVAATDIGPEPPTTASVGVPNGPTGDFNAGAVGATTVGPGFPEVVPAAPPSGPVRPGGVIKTPVKIRHVPPVYPTIAQQAGVQGIVLIEAVVGVDGRVVEARILRSKPLLDEAALTAVRQWEFTPTTLNGVPVPVLMTVTVNFTLR